ncbi:MAG: hypothetical protein EZS28_008616 [Streblomastix strix]|uniref:DNA-directed DNA polymerase n=1 Tax=Streblomastix strix TaxID=222440 RepID=A0A5J4WMJ8_9EUKA|nr:MAG: hypothetical protein EZS28_008616 [Streblomastix strix]
MELKQAAKDFGETYGLSSANGYDDKKGLFPYQAFNTDNVNEELRIDFIKRIQYDKDAKKVTVLTTDHRITHVVGVDFNSLYPSVMSSEPHKFIKYAGSLDSKGVYTGEKMYKFTADGQLFIAEVKGPIQKNYLNDFINFPPILRNYEFTTEERTIGSYMFNHMNDNTIKTDQKQRKIEAKLEENKGQEQFFKTVMNSSYGSDGMNIEKYHKVKIMNRKQTERAIRSNAFMDEQKISEDNYIVQMNPEHCSCKTPLQVAFVVLDMNRIHFVEGDTDSAYRAISGNLNEDFTQQFNDVVKDRDFYYENAKYFYPTFRGDVYDEKKVLRQAIERQGSSMIALAPKNYIIFKNYCDDSKIKLQRFNQKTNKITKDQIVDCINEDKITKWTNMRLEQKNHQMSQLSIEKNGITRIHTKMIVLENHSCCPFMYGLTAKDSSVA